MNLAPVSGLHPIGGDALGIGRPCNRVWIVRFTFGSVDAEHHTVFAGAVRPDVDVVIPNQRLPFPIWRYRRPIRRQAPLAEETTALTARSAPERWLLSRHRATRVHR